MRYLKAYRFLFDSPHWLLHLLAGTICQAVPVAGPFVQDFLRRVGRETLLAQLFVATSGTSIVLLGVLCLCVPMFPALALVHFAQYHLTGQLYRLYRARGGEAVQAVVSAPLSAGN